VSGQFHAPVALSPGKDHPGTHWTRGSLGPRACLDVMEKRKGFTPARNQTPTVQPVARHYIDRVIQAARRYRCKMNSLASEFLPTLSVPVIKKHFFVGVQK
jgi:hypothetical protein